MLLTRQQAINALNKKSAVYDKSGISVIIVGVTYGERWKAEIEYSDGSRTHCYPADLTLASDIFPS